MESDGNLMMNHIWDSLAFMSDLTVIYYDLF